MSTRKLSNVSISQFESFLELAGCKNIKNQKGHFKYLRSDLFRPVIFQNHIDPVPEFIVKNILRLFPYSKDEFFEILEGEKRVERVGNKFNLVQAK